MKLKLSIKLAAALCATFVAAAAMAQDKKPNILFIMGDDVGWFNIGAYHQGIMSGKTPNLDKLASQGMRFTDYYAEASCTAGRANFITGELPIRTGLTTVGQAGADVVFAGIITPNNAGKLWQDLRDTLGPNVKLMGPDGIYEQAFIDAAGQAAEGSYITFGGVPPSKLTGKGAQWYASYKQQFNGAEPEAYAAYAYESAKVVIQAIQTAGGQCAVHNSAQCRGAVRDAIMGTKNFDGVLGQWSFSDTGDTTLTAMSGRQIKDGAFDDANSVVLTAPQ